MSAQMGIWNFDGNPVDSSDLQRYTAALERYGPDGAKGFTDNAIAIVYRPFHVTRESYFEVQPRVSANGDVITWDGRLDNREDLLSQLQGDLNSASTDLAIVAAAFEKWEVSSFRRLVGDWALCIWRPRAQELVLAVDFLSVRHIFYSVNRQRILWSTDPTTLVLLSPNKFHIDENYIAGYLANEPETRLTPYRELHAIPAGHSVRVQSDGRMSLHRYWTFNPKQRIRYKTDAEYADHFRQLFRQSVQRRLRSSSPVLAELSGGLDSSSIVCMADDVLTTKAPTPRLDTISLIDMNEPNGDDRFFLRKVENKRGRVGHHIQLDTNCEWTSFNNSEFSPFPGYLMVTPDLSRERSAIIRNGGYSVVLSGLGGDEFMGGNPDASPQLADLLIQGRMIAFMSQVVAWSLAKRQPCLRLVRDALVMLMPAFVARHVAKAARIDPWIQNDFAYRTGIARLQLPLVEYSRFLLPSRRCDLRAMQLIANKLSRRILREAPIETRYPYLDQDLLEFVLSVPAEQFLRPGQRRSLMRRALIGIVPPEILSRTTKQFGGRTPLMALERNRTQLQISLSRSLACQLGFVHQEELLTALQSALAGKTANIARLLKAISLEFWLQDIVSRKIVDIDRAVLRHFAAVGMLHAEI